jgi:hypothetical protein
MMKSGLADSPFFTVLEKPTVPAPSQETSRLVQKKANEKNVLEKKLSASQQPGIQAVMQTSKHA